MLDAKRIRFYLKVSAAYLFFWIFIAFVREPKSSYLWALNEIWHGIYIFPLMYFFFEYTIPELSRKKILRSIILIAIQLFLFSFVSHVWREFGIIFFIHTPFSTLSSCQQVGYQFGLSLFAVFFFGLARHIYNHTQLKHTAQRLKIEKQEAELNYLKSQTNPHFLFNTLNNIYSLARDKSNVAPESILRLSKILRYMLYETSGAFIAVEQEIKIINDYIELEKLRYDDSLYVNFNYNIEDMKQSLPPLLLIPLVENAFKHGVSETRANPFVDIHLEIKNRHLNMTIKNSSSGIAGLDEVKENIGLSNLRRQLELLYTDYDLSVKQEKMQFISILKINLASHV